MKKRALDKRGFLESEFLAMVLLAILVVAGMKVFELTPVFLNSIQEKANAAALVRSKLEDLIITSKTEYDTSWKLQNTLTPIVTDYPGGFTVSYTVHDNLLLIGPVPYKEISATCTYGPDHSRKVQQTTWITR